MPNLDQITYTSELTTEYRERLEHLLFLNPGQHRVRDEILAAIQGHGVPSVISEGGRLRIRLKEGTEVQSLYALTANPPSGELVGAMVYTRSNLATLLVLHIAVEDAYSSQGRRSKEMLVLHFVVKLRQIASRINGIKSVRLLYGGTKVQDIMV